MKKTQLIVFVWQCLHKQVLKLKNEIWKEKWKNVFRQWLRGATGK